MTTNKLLMSIILQFLYTKSSSKTQQKILNTLLIKRSINSNIVK